MSEAKFPVTEQSVRNEPGEALPSEEAFLRHGIFHKVVKLFTNLQPDLLVAFKPREELLEDLVLLADPADEFLEFPIDVQG